MKFKKLMGWLHLWLGLISGLVVLILGITGCLYCFEKELKPLFYADRMFVDTKAAGQALPIDVLLNKAQAALGPRNPVTHIEFEPGGKHTYEFITIKFNRKAYTYSDNIEVYKTVYINPYTGKIQAVENTKYEFFNLVLQLHFSLLLGEPGRFIVKWSTVMFAILLVTGIVLWWPKNRAAAKQRFWFVWKKSTRFKRKNYDLHNIPGFYSMFIALVIALTGIVFGFPAFRLFVGWAGNGFKPVPVVKPALSDTLQTVKTVNYQAIAHNVLQHSPATARMLINMPGAKSAPILAISWLKPFKRYKRNYYNYDQYNGKLLKQKPFALNSSGELLLAMNYDIHVGSIAGLPGEILAFIASLIAASLPVTGFLIWWGKQKKPKKAIKHKAVPVLSATA